MSTVQLTVARSSLAESTQSAPPDSKQVVAKMAAVFELAYVARQSYLLASPASKREMALLLTSNRTVAARDVFTKPYFPIALIADAALIHSSGHQWDAIRTSKKAAEDLWKWAKEEAAKTAEEREGERERSLNPRERKLRRVPRHRWAA